MVVRFKRITIIKIEKPKKKDLNEDIKWISNSLGLISSRDKEKSCYRIFIELIKAANKGVALSSDEIAKNAHLSRGTVIHHLNALMGSGIITYEKRRYLLKADNLETLIDEIKGEILKVFKNLKNVAKELDEELNLVKR